MKNQLKAAAVMALAAITPATAADMKTKTKGYADGTTPVVTYKAPCDVMTKIPSAIELLPAADLGAAANGQSDVGFFVPSTKVVNESSVTANATFGRNCKIVSFETQTTVSTRHAEGPGILAAVATGVGIAAGGALNGALTRPATTTISNAGSSAVSNAAGGAGGTAFSASSSKSSAEANASASAKLDAKIVNAPKFVNKPTFNNSNKVVQNPKGGYLKNGKPCDQNGKYLQGKNGKYSFIVRPGYNFG